MSDLPTGSAAPPPSLAPSPNVNLVDLLERVNALGPREAYELLDKETDETIVAALAKLNPALMDEVLWEFPEVRRVRVLQAAPAFVREQWVSNHAYPEDTIGRLMEPPVGVFPTTLTVAEVIEQLRPIVKRAFVTYGWIVDSDRKLQGVLVFRELLFARPDQPVSELMVPKPFWLDPTCDVTDAMKTALKYHFPVYPVCDADGRLLGVVRGQRLFEQQAFEISAQAGTMVGVDKEERLATPWPRSLKMRHPWLQLNLLTAFVAASVVGVFSDTLDQLVVLAVFLPVLAGQSGNTGCQALAVVLRAMTLGEMKEGRASVIVFKEALLGFFNGSMVGVTAGLGMYFYASSQGNAEPLMLAFTVLLAMIGSCTASGVAGPIARASANGAARM
jgi:magnesium transporter